MLDPYELQVFLTAAETESSSATAHRLHLTQPAVSKQIQTLEQRLMRSMYTSAALSTNLYRELTLALVFRRVANSAVPPAKSLTHGTR